MTFAEPCFFLLLLLIPFLWIHYVKTEDKITRKMKVPGLPASFPSKSGRVRWRHIPFFLRVIAIIILVIALARPQRQVGNVPLSVEGIDIMLSLDISGSMLARDFKPDRLQAAIKVANDFIEKRTNDRIGLVIFAAESFTQCPLTTDHNVLNTLLSNINIDMLQDGTAIGMGLATAVSRLKNSEVKNRIVILMTDGENNTGYIDPITAMEMAKSEHVKVYTIGIGKKGVAPFPFKDSFTGKTVYRDVEVNIDEELLNKIAKETGGKYYRAENNRELNQIYEDINHLEKSKIKVNAFVPKEELYFPFILAGLFLLIFEWIFRTFYLKQYI
ncbi:MAG: VWA domain-containing protein [Chitinophagales bacterium]|nr:VWA domain-containing protein [Chitinophagales bacterium]